MRTASSSSSEIVIIFNRIPKTGSTFVEKKLKKLGMEGAFKIQSIHHWPHWHLNKTLKDIHDAIDGDVNVIEGHLPMGFAENILNRNQKIFKTVLFVRNPKKRLISHISFLMERNALIIIDGTIRYTSQPEIPLEYLLYNHQFKWLTSFFTGYMDNCIQMNDFKPAEFIKQLSQNPCKMMEELQDSSHSSILIAPTNKKMHIEFLLGCLGKKISQSYLDSIKADLGTKKNTTSDYAKGIINSLAQENTRREKADIKNISKFEAFELEKHEVLLESMIKRCLNNLEVDSKLWEVVSKNNEKGLPTKICADLYV